MSNQCYGPGSDLSPGTESLFRMCKCFKTAFWEAATLHSRKHIRLRSEFQSWCCYLLAVWLGFLRSDMGTIRMVVRKKGQNYTKYLLQCLSITGIQWVLVSSSVTKRKSCHKIVLQNVTHQKILKLKILRALMILCVYACVVLVFQAVVINKLPEPFASGRDTREKDKRETATQENRF